MNSIRALFPRAAAGGYLDTAAEGLPAPGLEEALSEYLAEKRSGTPGRKRHFAVEQQARELAAALLDAPLNNTIFLPTASDALNILAASLPWRPGDRVVTSDLEFPSNILPWLALRSHGIEVVVVKSRDGALQVPDVLNAISSRTKLVSLSLVSYKTGAYFPELGAVADAVHDHGGFLCVDATQAVGRSLVPLHGIDYLMASSFKWLMGPHGLALVYLSDRLRGELNLAGVGWYSVENVFTPERFETYELKPGAACLLAGMPNFASLYGICASLRFHLKLDRKTEQEKSDHLSRRLRRELADMRVPLLTPEDPRLTSGIVAFEHEYPEELASTLQEHGITVWAGDGRVRASLHFYNDDEDVNRYLFTLKAAGFGKTY